MEEENDMPLMLRMRDDAISTKDRQLAIVTSQNDQLRASLEQVEAELGDLLETLVKKDKELQKLQRTRSKRERELARLRVMESQAAGKDQAMEVLGKQNATLLKLLETKEDESRNLTIENGGMRDELKRQTFFSEKRVAKAAHQNERIKHTLREESLHARSLADERDGLATSLAGAEAERALVKLEAKAELACVADELVARRDGQYDLMLRLQHADDSTRRVADKLESQRNATDEARARAAELQSRLDAALAQLRAAEGEGARERAKAAADAASQRKSSRAPRAARGARGKAPRHDRDARCARRKARAARAGGEGTRPRADALARDVRVAGERADARERERDGARRARPLAHGGQAHVGRARRGERAARGREAQDARRDDGTALRDRLGRRVIRCGPPQILISARAQPAPRRGRRAPPAARALCARRRGAFWHDRRRRSASQHARGRSATDLARAVCGHATAASRARRAPAVCHAHRARRLHARR